MTTTTVSTTPVTTTPGATRRRPGSEADQIGGVGAGEVARPESIEEVREILRTAQVDGSSVVPHGARTKLGWAAPPSSCDVALDLTGLDEIVEHTAGDLVVVAQAGVRLADLQKHVGAAGQMLALDPPEQGATLGGILSANASGPRRLRYGTVRDLLIGVTVVLADGTIAVSGGKVVKNVAGYDLGKLYTGAHGTLGAVVSTTWRLHPLPPARRVVTLPVADSAEAGRLVQLLVRSPLTPTAVELIGAGGSMSLSVLFESIEESVQAQSVAATARLGGGTTTEELPERFGQRPGGPGDLVLRLAYQPYSLPAVLDALPGDASYSCSASGIAYVALPVGAQASGATIALEQLRAAVAPHDGTVVVLSAPAGLQSGLDHWGPVGDSLDLMRRVKDRFDPKRQMSPGRFVGGL